MQCNNSCNLALYKVQSFIFVITVYMIINNVNNRIRFDNNCAYNLFMYIKSFELISSAFEHLSRFTRHPNYIRWFTFTFTTPHPHTTIKVRSLVSTVWIPANQRTGMMVMPPLTSQPGYLTDQPSFLTDTLDLPSFRTSPSWTLPSLSLTIFNNRIKCVNDLSQ